MRNFRQDEIRAARLSPEIPETDFSWSPARHFVFRTCLRRYFLRYYFSQGGWDTYADSLVRLVYDIKKTAMREYGMEREALFILRTALRNASKTAKGLRQNLFSMNLLGAVSALSSKYDQYEDPAFVKNLSVNLTSFFKTFLRSETCQALLTMPPSSLLPDSAAFDFQGTNIWYEPGIRWIESGELLCSVHPEFSEPSSEFLRIEAGTADLAAAQTPGVQHSISFFFIQEPDGSWSEHAEPGDREYAKSVITRDIRDMRDMLRNGSAHVEDFPVREDVKACEKCPYQSACAAVSEAFDLL